MGRLAQLIGLWLRLQAVADLGFSRPRAKSTLRRAWATAGELAREAEEGWEAVAGLRGVLSQGGREGGQGGAGQGRWVWGQ